MKSPAANHAMRVCGKSHQKILEF